MKKSTLSAAVLGLTTFWSFGAITINISFTDIGEGGVGGSGLTQAQQDVFAQAATQWETFLGDYKAGVTGPAAITISASGPSIDGAGGILGQAGPNAFVTSGGYTLTSAGEMAFDSADLAAMQANGTFEGVILHEMGHVLGSGTLWVSNGVYVDGTGKYTGADALAKYQRDFDPTATSVPVELDFGGGTANAHWDEESGIAVINPDAPYFGELLDDELMTGFATGSLYFSDVTLGMFSDIGYDVEYIIPDTPIYYWDTQAGNGAIDGGTGTWDGAITNWTIDDGLNNTVFEDLSNAIFSETAGVVTISGTVNPGQMIFTVDGYELVGGTINTDAGVGLTIESLGDTVTLNTTISGTGAFAIDGLGTVINNGTIASDLDLTSAVTLQNFGAGVISGDITTVLGSTLASDGGGLGAGVTITNSGTVTITGDETISAYASEGGLLDGVSKLTAATYTLSNNAQVDANLGTGAIFVTDGNVALNGTADITSLDISTGSKLTVVTNAFTGAPTVSNGGELELTGNLTAGAYSATGVLSGNGILSVASFSGGTVETNVTGVGQLSLLVDVAGGDVTLGSGSTLDFGVVDQGFLETFNVYPLFANANSIIGDATSIGFESFNVSGLTTGSSGYFDVSSGQLYVISAGGGGVSGGTANTAAVANGIFGATFTGSDTFTNIDGLPSNAGAILSLATTLAGADLNDEITFQTQLEELSPEVYGGVSDYALRSHLNFLDSGMASTNVVRTGKLRVFAGLSTYDAESDSSIDDSDYNLQSSGGYFGITHQINATTRLGIMGAADTGDIKADRLSLDAKGTMIGIFTETELNMPFNEGVQWGILKTSLSISDYSYDGTRMAQGLTNTVNDIETAVLQAGISYRAELFNGPNYKVTPFVGAHYVKATTDAFTETGSINSLAVDETTKQLLLFEYGFETVWQPVSDKWGLTGMLKAQHNLGDSETEMNASFAGAASPFKIVSPGFSDMFLEVRAGAFFNVGKGATLRFSGYKLIGDDYEDATGANLNFEVEW